ncbi:hypothetical protein B0T10DRAFT_534948 [Thelonectria olida]|uniref:SEC63 domain-containing protein n=1 Tax=Thelonectria olida TaxID=1576542 RepID=A0A9P9AXD4_9HYPO|nr:hypothetical protein B0T10DRAFT_534948 [Thelonectria olida]
MPCQCFIVPPHLLRAIADCATNADHIRHAARRSLNARDAYIKCRADRLTALATPREQQHQQQIIPPHVLRNLSQSEEVEESVREHAKLDHEHVEGLMQKKLGSTEKEQTLAATTKSSPKRSVYDANHITDESGLPGKLIRKEGGDKSKDKAANEAYDNVGIVLEFYKKRFDWNSIDNKNMDVVSSVHFGEEYENAFWDSEKLQMVYGDGGEFLNNFTGCIDVIGHELTHAVTEHTSPLDYNGQAGALNEHVSDVFGIMIKQQVQNEKSAVADWLIGEDCILPGVKGVALRSMKAPGTAYNDPRFGKDPQPDNMRDYKVMVEDNGGVHVYSGIPNKAFQLASVAFGGYSWEKAGKIWWETMKSGKIAPKAQFKHFADITIETAEGLFDKEAAEIVRKAWTDVGIQLRYNLAPTTFRTLCTIGKSPSRQDILKKACFATEFRSFPIKPTEKAFFREINDHTAIPYSIPESLSQPWHKIFLLVQIDLLRTGWPRKLGAPAHKELHQNLHRIYSLLDQVLRCLVDILGERNDGSGVSTALDVLRSVKAGVWEGSEKQLLQVEGIGMVKMNRLIEAGIKTIQQLSRVEFYNIERLLSRNPPFGQKISHDLAGFPVLTLSLEVLGEYIPQSIGSVKHTNSEQVAHDAVGSSSGPNWIIRVVLGFTNKQVPCWKKKTPWSSLVIVGDDGRLVWFWRGGLKRLVGGKEMVIGVRASKGEALKVIFTCEETVGTMVRETLQL